MIDSSTFLATQINDKTHNYIYIYIYNIQIYIYININIFSTKASIVLRCIIIYYYNAQIWNFYFLSETLQA